MDEQDHDSHWCGLTCLAYWRARAQAAERERDRLVRHHERACACRRNVADITDLPDADEVRGILKGEAG